jgi:hypothetical protein
VSESKLFPVSWTELVKRLRKLGFERAFFYKTLSLYERGPVLRRSNDSFGKAFLLRKGLF